MFLEQMLVDVERLALFAVLDQNSYWWIRETAIDTVSEGTPAACS
jgi:hypothetical protein